MSLVAGLGGGAGDGKRAVGDGLIPKIGPAGLADGLDAGGKSGRMELL